MKKLTKETVMYLIVGIATTVIDYVAAMIAFSILNEELTANTTAWVVAVAFAYITNKLFVFESKSFQKDVLLHEIPSFVGSRVATLIGGNIIVYVATIFGIPFSFSKIASSGFAIVGNYVLSKLFVFKNEKSK